MPNIITHTLFANEFLEDASTSLQEWLLPRKQLVEIGANGPDFLFFQIYLQNTTKQDGRQDL